MLPRTQAYPGTVLAHLFKFKLIRNFTLGLIVPPFIALVVYNVPPSHVNKLSSNDVFAYPEINGCRHQHHNVRKSFRENNRQEEVTKVSG
jgi:hypothetical protein